MTGKRGFNNRGQVTLFIILAILIVGGIVVYFSFRGEVSKSIPVDLEPVYNHYLVCVKNTVQQGIALLGERGGYIYVPPFVPGSAYMPFSSQLDFLGEPVPYWMYVSGNNLLREQVPSKKEMEDQLSRYIKEHLDDCDFSDFEKAGYDVYVDNKSSVDVKINKLNVDVDIENLVSIYSRNNSALVKKHSFSLNSKLGKFYDLAIKVYNFEKKRMFLEKYALDVMRLYAPVTGTELSCTPKIFVDSEIRKKLVEGLSLNIPTLKLKGDYYSLGSSDRKYFVSDAGFDIDENVNFMYSPDWPTRIEIYGDKVATPVGIQQGLGILGFCYVPYHLVYDIDFPVLVQFYDSNELFQFPVAVIISKNQAREAQPTTAGAFIEPEECKHKNSDLEISTYDEDLNPVEAIVRFKCINSVCDLGQTSLNKGSAVLKTKAPACVNGFIIARADGFADTKYQISTNEESSANIILRKKHKLYLNLGDVKKAFVSFSSDDYSISAMYPETKSIELVDGYYNVSVYVYDNSSLKIPATKQRKCVDVPASGIAGFFGAEKEKCYDVEFPEMNVGMAIVGGGKTQSYLTSEQLKNSKEIDINVPLFSKPRSLEDLQKNQLAVEDSKIYVDLK